MTRAHDLDSGEFTPDPSYMTRIFFDFDASDVEEVTEDRFEAEVADLASVPK